MTKINTRKSPEHTRQLVLTATLQLFTEKGYFNTSVRDIARESQVSIGSIYHHFKDKEGVASAMYNDLLKRMSESLDDIQRNKDSAYERCHAVIELLFKVTEEEPRLMEFMMYSKHREFLPDEAPICSAQPFKLMREMVAHGMETGEIQNIDLMVASSCLYGGAIRMITSRLDGIIEKSLLEYVDSVWECSWRSIAVNQQV
ncbi:MAG: TetR/AcrR family transcriptional regulator [Gammaproteobacteria bacterium]|nr:TetR/AcrR family transcriptional regulator [Gammaproteobacteria bacterium]